MAPTDRRLNFDETPHTCSFNANGHCTTHAFTRKAPLSEEKRFYRVTISRELQAYASSETEAMDMARKSEQYAVPKVTAEVIDAPPNEAIPL